MINKEKLKENSCCMKENVHARKSWSKEVWNKSASIYHAILKQKFLEELSNGTLDKDVFGRYIAQDEIYLRNYYHQLFMLAELMDNETEKELFVALAKSGMEGEKAMHEMLIDKYGIETEVRASEVTADYNEHICKGIATGNPCIALAAILPCMWIYNRVGLYILNRAQLDNNPYKEWILEYGNEEATNNVNQVLEMIDAWAVNADEETKERMDDYFLQSALYEYAFWDYGYYSDEKSYDYTNNLEEWL